MVVKPAPGLTVRDPATRLALPPDGVDVPDTSYWRRRIASGDVILCAPAQNKPRKEAK